ncbi:uncharacterized protein VP01_1529g1 [Puccinia sorghi]|uniref:Retrotransposon gag domain-containing protein n=1 Tax=Puccinia sorghi TaxID=27349 RepID=A0A0L6VIM3_9BASI|nr:uncharacterized protein VP01_1529g1 [Puccinia sorghi]
MPNFSAERSDSTGSSDTVTLIESVNEQRARVDQLSTDVTQMGDMMKKMMSFLEASPILNPPPPEASSAADHHRGVPPHIQASSNLPSSIPIAPDTGYLPPANHEFSHLSRLEPLKLQDVWFSGDSITLAPFLRTIRNFLRPRSSLFQTETRRVLWVAQHFGFRPSENRKIQAPSENWFSSLLLDNARKSGVVCQYADLDGVPFTLPALLSVDALVSEMIAIFGDKFSKENAKRQLANCRQRGLPIGEYNAQFSSLVYLVEDVEANRIDKYVAGLNPRIIHKAMGKEWRSADTLAKKMELASEAAADIDVLAALPPVAPLPNSHAPLSSNRPPSHFPPRHHSNPAAPDPDAMEIDATTARLANPASSLFDSSRSICRARKLCFRCLKPVVPGVHSGSLNCPNPPITMEQRQSFVDKYRRQPLPTQVSAVEVSTLSPSQPPPLAFQQEVLPPPDVQFPSPFDAADMVNLDEHYEDYEEADCATVQVHRVSGIIAGVAVFSS